MQIIIDLCFQGKLNDFTFRLGQPVRVRTSDSFPIVLTFDFPAGISSVFVLGTTVYFRFCIVR